ncbi:MAG TPA: IclR family transcriptional regulator [Acetobacteraceae bacterium]|nr:IclR family transcriptional regulator [Acetobacteraceae bacterium]
MVNRDEEPGTGSAGEGETDDRYRAPALDKGLDILELLTATDEGVSQAEIAKALGRSPSEIYRMLDRLVRRGYVLRSAGDRYELSLKLFALVHQHPPLRRLVSQALPLMRRFAREALQACHIAVYERGRAVVVAQVDAPGYWGIAIRLGAQVDLLNTGSGHVLLAFQTPRERDHMLAERRAIGSSTVPAGFEQRLAGVRRRGYEVMRSQQTKGVINLSVPVLGVGGSAIAALTCPFIEHMDISDGPGQDAVARLLLRTTEALTHSA